MEINFLNIAFAGLGLFLLMWAPSAYKNRQYIHSIYIEWRNERSHRWLRKHDLEYRKRAISEEVIKRREEVRRRGGSHDDLDRIDHASVSKEL